MALPTSPAWPIGGLDPVIEALQEEYLPQISDYDLGGLLCDTRLGRRAIVSSFGAESVVLLHYVSRLVPDIDVLFIDTHKHFRETLEYRDTVAQALNLNLVNVEPDKTELAKEDPYGSLFNIDVNMCCTLRKVFPLQDALRGYDSWVSGRKRFQASTRAAIPVLERDTDKIKINPLALWSKHDIDSYFFEHDLPRHPLEAKGYPSIGCQPCTRAVKPGEDVRAGRWAGTPDKTECGLHIGPDGNFARKKSKS
ncbi:phosphoadenylyl-sulfate reductase [uncultured Sulfitobacter sp.]|uniref:phosphoadenylyl-sulfate reductase n=1 Tax=uncultured Sulfitobacter sp. TaxID=191468 RepID=UPI00260A4FBA|nr:phosphoadenylyl-sulfate reductase [uncultured Sulfitobacter sp.]